MTTPRLSIVAPVFNEQEVVIELVSRCVRAAELSGATFEVVIVDDGSTDATAQRLATFEADERVVRVEPGRNVGQFRATKTGLRVARGDYVCVLDGDLQDPPEIITALVERLDHRPDVDLIYATKRSRVDPLWFRMGRAGYRLLSRLGKGAPPSGSGSYCLMSATLARRVADHSIQHANLAPVVWSQLAEGESFDTVPYDKAARYDGRSRVGLGGLIAEALGSLSVTGALSRWVWVGLGLVLAAGALGWIVD